MTRRPPSASAIGWLFVSAQIVLLGALVLVPGARHWVAPTAVAGGAHAAALAGLGIVAVAALGLGSALTATPVPKAHAGLRTGGLYRFSRHPIYSGVLLFVIGTVVASGSVWKLAIGVVTLVFFNAKARWEESQLRSAYPDYAAYAARTPRFIPHPRLHRRP